eukprot:3411897-Amphidinium_carterae.2
MGGVSCVRSSKTTRSSLQAFGIKVYQVGEDLRSNWRLTHLFEDKAWGRSPCKRSVSSSAGTSKCYMCWQVQVLSLTVQAFLRGFKRLLLFLILTRPERIGIMPSLHLDSIDDDSDKSASGKHEPISACRTEFLKGSQQP